MFRGNQKVVGKHVFPIVRRPRSRGPRRRRHRRAPDAHPRSLSPSTERGFCAPISPSPLGQRTCNFCTGAADAFPHFVRSGQGTFLRGRKYRSATSAVGTAEARRMRRKLRCCADLRLFRRWSGTRAWSLSVGESHGNGVDCQPESDSCYAALHPVSFRGGIDSFPRSRLDFANSSTRPPRSAADYSVHSLRHVISA